VREVTLFRTPIAVERTTLPSAEKTLRAHIRYNIFPTILQKITMRTLAFNSVYVMQYVDERFSTDKHGSKRNLYLCCKIT